MSHLVTDKTVYLSMAKEKIQAGGLYYFDYFDYFVSRPITTS